MQNCGQQLLGRSEFDFKKIANKTIPLWASNHFTLSGVRTFCLCRCAVPLPWCQKFASKNQMANWFKTVLHLVFFVGGNPTGKLYKLKWGPNECIPCSPGKCTLYQMAKDISQQMHKLASYFAKDATKGVRDGLLSGEDIEVHQILRQKCSM